MNGCEWIVCERNPRWAPALRTILARDGQTLAQSIHEVRRLSELTEWLRTTPQSAALVEATADRLDDLLHWLAMATRRFPAARFVVAVDSTLNVDDVSTEIDEQTRQDVIDILLEAGATEIVDSPRRLHGIVGLGRRHAEFCAPRSAQLQHVKPSVADAAWAALPWQDG